MTELGHVVYYVRNLEDSLRFYHEAVGLDVSGKIFNDRAALLTGGRKHHELLLIEVGEATGPLAGKRIGLYHVGWKIGESLQDLKFARSEICVNPEHLEMIDQTGPAVAPVLSRHDPQ